MGLFVGVRMRALSLALILAAGGLGAEEAVSSTAQVVQGPSVALEELYARVESIEKDNAQWRQKLVIEGYGQLRFDGLQYKAVGFSSPQGVTPLVHSEFESFGGAYVKRLEMKLSGPLFKNIKWIAGFGFEEAKLKDVGFEWANPELFGQNTLWTVQLGQFRQKFGVEPQIGSPKIPFIERALMYGGNHPLPGGLKLIGERVLGVHSTFRQSFGPLGYEAGLSVSDDGNDQLKGSNTLFTAFPAEPLNGQATVTGRLGLSFDKPYPGAGALKLGASFQNDDRGSRTYTAGTTVTAGVMAYTYGLDVRLEAIKGWWWLQGEWIKADLHGHSSSLAPVSMLSAKEAWYATSTFKVGQIPEVDNGVTEFLVRYERLTPAVGGAGFPAYLTSITFGLNLRYGRAATAINLSEYAPEDHFTEAGDLRRIMVQQQFTY